MYKRQGLSIEQQGIGDLDGIGAVGAQEQLGIIEAVKIVDGIAGAELDALDLLEVDIINLLLAGSASCEADTVQRILQGRCV